MTRGRGSLATCVLLLTAVAAAAAASPAHGQTESIDAYPSRPIRIVVPFLPGGTSDGIVRIIAKQMGETWKQPILVDAKPGAGGAIGAAEAARAKPDGYTLVLLVTGHMILPAINRNVGYAMPDDFTPVSIISRSAKLVVTSAASPVSSFPDLLARVKADPATWGSYGTSGIGSEAHLSMELVNQLAGTKFSHVPYRGGVGPLTDLVENRLPVGLLDIGSVLSQIKAGRLKALAISSAARSPVLPDVPRIADTLPAFESSGWYGIAGPKGMPAPIVAKLQKEIVAALRTPEAKTRFVDGLGWELPGTTPEQMASEMATQTKKWAELVQRVGVRTD